MSSHESRGGDAGTGASREQMALDALVEMRDEVSPTRRGRGVDLDTPFDRLGLGSLEMTELLLRLEERCSVRLPADLLSTAETPRDLILTVSQAPRREPRPTARTAPPQPAGTAVAGAEPVGPAEGETLTRVLDWHCDRHPDRVHLTLLDAADGRREISYGELRRSAAELAGGLHERGVAPGDSVALVLPTGASYFEVFLGVVLAGAVPVPIYPPTRRGQMADHLRRQTGILENARAVLLVTVPEARPLLRLLQAQVPTLRALVTADELRRSSPPTVQVAGPQETALVQYTSGSTGRPKGVVLSHANLLANIRAMATSADVRPDDVFVSWLPLYHDMGLIGAWLGSLTVGMRLAVMSPLEFLSRPSRWLWAMHDEGGTISAGPNFAYSLSAAKIVDDEIQGVDLSRWRLAFNGAEPVSAETLDRFAARFSAHGFRREALTPVYGLAESSVGLTFPPPGRGPIVDRVDRSRFLAEGYASPLPLGSAEGLRFVACGRPLPGHEIRIVDRAGREVLERHEGQIHFRGPSATSGYLRNPAASQALFVDGWLDTGDLGYVAGGDLYVTGRVKDMVVRAGRNLHPEEIEEAVGELAEVRTGCVAVFGAGHPQGESEKLVVVAETRLEDGIEREQLQDAIVATCVTHVDVPPDEVVLVRPGTVPKTSSGKIRRTAARELYRAGALTAPRPWQLAELARLGVLSARAHLGSLARRGADQAWAAYTAVLVALLVPVLLLALAVLPDRGRRRQVVRSGLRLLARAAGVPLVVRHVDRLPLGPTVLVANHPSWIDAAVLHAALPADITFVAGEVFASQPLAGFVLRRLGAEFVERHDPGEAVRDTERLIARVRAGETIMMFPEGHLDPQPGLREFHLGAFAVAARAGVPITPIVLRGTRRLLAPGRRWPRRGRAVVSVAESIHAEGPDWQSQVGLRDAARRAIASAGEETDLKP